MLVYQVLGADAYIEAGECLLEFKPRGGELKDEATKPTALDVDNLESWDSYSWESSIGSTPEISNYWSFISMSTPFSEELQVCCNCF